MNKKNIIQIVIILACFSASGIVIYNNFFKASAPPANLTVGLTPTQTEGQILPGGKEFDLGVIKKSGLRFNLLDYPQLAYPSEVGTSEGEVIKPLLLVRDGSGVP